MKTFFIATLMLAGITGYSQDSELPQSVEAGFQNKYATARMDDWWQEEDKYFVEFSVKGQSFTALFDEGGQWQETAESISDMDIPSSIHEFIQKQYPSAKVSFCEKVENNKGETFLRVSFQGKDLAFHSVRSEMNGGNIALLEADF